jgi:hypothetical protein
LSKNNTFKLGRSLAQIIPFHRQNKAQKIIYQQMIEARKKLDIDPKVPDKDSNKKQLSNDYKEDLT